VFVEFGDLWRNRFFQFVSSRECIRRLQAIAGDAEHRCFIWKDAVLQTQLASAADGDAACGFRENSFSLGQQLDAFNHLAVGDVLGPAAALSYGLDCIVAVGGIADGQRARNRRRLLRLDISLSGFDRRGNWRTTRSLRAKKTYRLGLNKA